MPGRASRPLAFTVFALVAMVIVASSRGTSIQATDYKVTVVAEVICNPSTPRADATPAIAASPSPVAIEFDQIYLDLMIMQKQRVMSLALVAADRAESPEVRQLAQQLVTTSEPVFQRLKDTRAAWFGDRPALQDAELMDALDAIGRLQPGVGSVPGAVEIVQGEGAVAELCAEDAGVDVHFLTALIGQLESGILLSETANNLAGRDETKLIVAEVLGVDQPLIGDAIAYRDVVLQGSPIPEDH